MPKKLPCGRPLPESVRPFGDWKKKLDAYLDEKKLRRSDQRERIVEIALAQPGHFNVQQIVRKIQDAHPGIGAATVYRNVRVLCDAGILKETLVDSEGQAFYEAWDEDHHDHVVCADCGHIFEFHDEKIEAAQRRAVEKIGFRELRHRHVIYASCEMKRPRR